MRNIQLIDENGLLDLMIKNQIGVKDGYRLSIDEEYFRDRLE
jgi:hypothetical protein